MYLVKSLTAAKAPDLPGHDVQWAAGQVLLVHDDVIQQYRTNTVAFTILAGPDVADCVVAATNDVLQDGIATPVASTGLSSADTTAQVHRATVTLVAAPITLTDDAGVGQYGNLYLYDMPAGNILVLGATVNADIVLNETWWVNTIAGDVGVGTTAVTDGNTLATTEQNIIATTAVAALVAQAGPINAQSAGQLITGTAGGTDASIYLNVRIDDDAAHMPQTVTNGAFAADTDWTKGTGWTIATGVASSDGSQTAVSDLSQAAGLVPGVTYTVSFDLVRTAGSVTPMAGGTAGTARATTNTFSEAIVAGADGTIAIRADADFIGNVDNVSAVPTTGTGAITGTVDLYWLNTGDY